MSYEKRIILFVDILGFTKEVENSLIDSNNISRIENTFREIQYLFSKNFEDSMEFTQFSDSVVISVPTNEKGCFYNILRDACLLIHNLFSSGFICKGVIIVDDVFHKEDLLFGPGFLNAMKKEAQEDLPRITFDEKYLELAKEQAYNWPNWELGLLSKYYMPTDQEGVLQVAWRENYGDLVGGGNEDTQNHYDLIKSAIEGNLKKTKKLRVLEKYLYLMEIYNNSGYGENKIKFKFPFHKRVRNYPDYIIDKIKSYFIKRYWKKKLKFLPTNTH